MIDIMHIIAPFTANELADAIDRQSVTCHSMYNEQSVLHNPNGRKKMKCYYDPNYDAFFSSLPINFFFGTPNNTIFRLFVIIYRV